MKERQLKKINVRKEQKYYNFFKLFQNDLQYGFAFKNKMYDRKYMGFKDD